MAIARGDRGTRQGTIRAGSITTPAQAPVLRTAQPQTVSQALFVR